MGIIIARCQVAAAEPLMIRNKNVKHVSYESCLFLSFSLSSSRGLCLCTKSSTQSSIFSASSVNQSHQCLCGGLLLVAGGVLAVADVLADPKPDVDAARLEGEEMTADMVAADGGADVNEWRPTGSLGVSLVESSSSLCRPTGFKGRRKVPLLGAGVRPMESQMMLYSSMFSAGLLAQ